MSRSKSEDDHLFDFLCDQVNRVGEIGRNYVRMSLADMKEKDPARADAMRQRLNKWMKGRKRK